MSRQKERCSCKYINGPTLYDNMLMGSQRPPIGRKPFEINLHINGAPRVCKYPYLHNIRPTYRNSLTLMGNQNL